MAYTTQSAYKMLSAAFERSSPSHRPLPPVGQNLWRSIWKLKTSPKIRHFLWRALSGALTVKERLQSRNLTCPAAVEAWYVAQIPPPRSGFSQSSTFLNLHYLVAGTKKRNSDIGNFKSFPWILWNLWKSRNELVFENSRTSPFSCVAKSVEEANIWFELNEATLDTPAGTAGSPPGFTYWQRPSLGVIKCNVGSAWNRSSGLSGTGWLSRDHQGIPRHHSRRAFSNNSSKRERLICFLCIGLLSVW